jgi:hypothetical protein
MLLNHNNSVQGQIGGDEGLINLHLRAIRHAARFTTALASPASKLALEVSCGLIGYLTQQFRQALALTEKSAPTGYLGRRRGGQETEWHSVTVPAMCGFSGRIARIQSRSMGQKHGGRSKGPNGGAAFHVNLRGESRGSGQAAAVARAKNVEQLLWPPKLSLS